MTRTESEEEEEENLFNCPFYRNTQQGGARKGERGSEREIGTSL
jgi:hypothetical protein